MPVKKSTIALISAAIVTTFGIGYLVYFDQKRRTHPNFKKQLKIERKKASKVKKEKQDQELVSVEQLVKNVMAAVAAESFPDTPEAKEAYFMEKVALGEELVGKGETYYDESVGQFYKALKIYPAPLELIMIYQKSLPEKVFRIIVNIMALEQQKRQGEFYEQFPPEETGVKFAELSSDDKRRALTANKDFAKGDIIYTEAPLISALHPSLEGQFCNYCMKKLNEETKIECPNCDLVRFCSTDCETKGSQQYHTFLCTNSKVNADEEDVGSRFLKFTKENNLKYPQMIAQFLSSMVAEEMEKNKLGRAASPYSAWDHIERFESTDVEPSESLKKEADMIKDLLASKVPGVDEFLTLEIYALLKGKLNENSFVIPAVEAAVSEKSAEPARVLISEQNGLGSSIYKISSYLLKSELDESNVEISFRENSNVIIVTASKGVKQGEQIKAFYM